MFRTCNDGMMQNDIGLISRRQVGSTGINELDLEVDGVAQDLEARRREAEDLAVGLYE